MNVLAQTTESNSPSISELCAPRPRPINGLRDFGRRFSRAGAPQQRHDGRVDPSGGAVGVCDSWSGSVFDTEAVRAQSTRAQPNLKFLHPKLARLSRAAAIPIRIGARRFQSAAIRLAWKIESCTGWRGLSSARFHSPMDCLGECAGRQSRQVTYRRQSQEPASRRKRSALSLERAHRRPRLFARFCFGANSRARSFISPPRSHVDRSITAPTILVRTNRQRHIQPA